MNILTKYGKVELIILKCFEELSLKEIKKQYDLGEKYCIDYLKKFDSGEYNESLQDILSELNIDNSILYMNTEEIPDKGYLEGELINDLKNLNDNDSYTVARLKNVCHCVELHYIDGKSTIEYGTRTSNDSWENKIENIDWFDKNMSISDLENKLENLFDVEFGEKDYEL
mgnify:CR=1 FL=1